MTDKRQALIRQLSVVFFAEGMTREEALAELRRHPARRPARRLRRAAPARVGDGDVLGAPRRHGAADLLAPASGAALNGLAHAE